jgi:hypothetical protein
MFTNFDSELRETATERKEDEKKWHLKSQR